MRICNVSVENRSFKEELTHKEEVVLRFYGDYPQFAAECFPKPVAFLNTFYQGKARAFEQYCRRRLFPQAADALEAAQENNYPFRMYEAVLAYELTYNQNCAVSLYFDRYEYTGGAHGSTLRTSDSWDLRRARRITLPDLIRSPDVRAFVVAEVNRQIKEQIAAGNDVYFEDYESLTLEHFNPESFYLTPDGVAVYYQQYDIAPYSTGIPVFVIPYSRTVRQPSCR